MILCDSSDEYDILQKNGMFRNRNTPGLAKPISGSNVDTADQPGEIELHTNNLISIMEDEIMQTLKEALPEEY